MDCDVEVAAVLPVLCMFRRLPMGRVAWLFDAEHVFRGLPRTCAGWLVWLLVGGVVVVLLELLSLLLRVFCCLVTSVVSIFANSLIWRSFRIIFCLVIFCELGVAAFEDEMSERIGCCSVFTAWAACRYHGAADRVLGWVSFVLLVHLPPRLERTVPCPIQLIKLTYCHEQKNQNQ